MGQDWHDLRSLNGLGFLREAAVNWSLEGAYDAYPQIEEEFSAALDESLSPRDPSMLLDLVAEFGLAPGSVAVDVGCGEAGRGSQSGFRY
jgi:predicted TPR repeat methyltransferase